MNENLPNLPNLPADFWDFDGDQLHDYMTEQLVQKHELDEQIKALKWARMLREQIDAALARGEIEIVGFDAVGEPIYQGVKR